MYDINAIDYYQMGECFMEYLCNFDKLETIIGFINRNRYGRF